LYVALRPYPPFQYLYPSDKLGNPVLSIHAQKDITKAIMARLDIREVHSKASKKIKIRNSDINCYFSPECNISMRIKVAEKF